MEVGKIVNGDDIILKVNGKLDSVTSIFLQKEIDNILISEKVNKLEIDMSELLYLSSAGLRVLLNVHKKLNSLEAHLVITNANENVKSVFEITGFLGILDIV